MLPLVFDILQNNAARVTAVDILLLKRGLNGDASGGGEGGGGGEGRALTTSIFMHSVHLISVD